MMVERQGPGTTKQRWAVVLNPAGRAVIARDAKDAERALDSQNGVKCSLFWPLANCFIVKGSSS
jgi:hypothetical protein